MTMLAYKGSREGPLELNMSSEGFQGAGRQ